MRAPAQLLLNRRVVPRHAGRVGLLPHWQVSVAPSPHLATQGAHHPPRLIDHLLKRGEVETHRRRSAVVEILVHLFSSVVEHRHPLVELENPLVAGDFEVRGGESS